MSKRIDFDTKDHRTGYFYDLEDKYAPFFMAESVEEAAEAYPFCPTGTVFMVCEINREKQIGKTYKVNFKDDE